MSTKPTLRLHLFHARESSRTVILRQGPSRTYRMILWDRDGDRFQDGQWLKHKVYIERCDISPDGEHFLYFALNARWAEPSKGAYTAICKTPYFTALRLYPQGDTWGGGGCFIDSIRFYIATADSTPDIIGAEAPLERVFRARQTLFNPFDLSGFFDAIGNLLQPDNTTRGQIAVGLPSPAYAIEPYETEGHCLYRRKEGTRELIRDFSDMAFEPIVAPYGLPRVWHRPDGDQT
jgi:hypothetical protein